MTTYNSYAAAKIANPNEEIQHLDGKIFVNENSGVPYERRHDWLPARASQFCMTVEKFLADGHKFIEGDLIYSLPLDAVIKVAKDELMDGESYSVFGANTATPSDIKRYILHAAALEEKQEKPRAKVGYVKCNFNHAWEAVKEHEEGKNIFHCQDSDDLNDDYPICGYDMHVIGECAKDGELYRRIETPIEWWDGIANYLKSEQGIETEFDSGHLSMKVSKPTIALGMDKEGWKNLAKAILEGE